VIGVFCEVNGGDAAAGRDGWGISCALALAFRVMGLFVSLHSFPGQP
jgi:hypothetical protein